MTPRTWYLAPRLESYEEVQKDKNGDDIAVQIEHRGPATGSPLEPVSMPAMECRAHSPVGGNVLVGLQPGVSAPSDWTPLTLREARAHFETVMGRQPSDTEVL